jgi:hypothetical protein
MHVQAPSARPSGLHPSQATLTQQCVAGRERAEVLRAGHTAPSPPATSALRQDLADRFPKTQGPRPRCYRPGLDRIGDAADRGTLRRDRRAFVNGRSPRLVRKSGQSSRGPPVAEAIRSLSSFIAWFEIPKRLSGSTARLNSAAQESAVLENTRGRNRCRILPTPW